MKDNTVVIHGPGGCGKTFNAGRLANKYGCKHIIDNWDGSIQFQKDTLVLTNLWVGNLDRPVLEYHMAMKDIQFGLLKEPKFGWGLS